ncbi:hypothetical protein DOZ80_07565 [Pseudomonas fluorescens]|uniref:Uncharacterized protein n=1 Tax=Pseudomonas fluorescens TaxID=294 RepID=A0A327NBW3_PSEFL|nr:hypothetical protein DOZ80_07565 [Pseudomonas fluorescens]
MACRSELAPGGDPTMVLRAPRESRQHVLSLTTITSKLEMASAQATKIAGSTPATQPPTHPTPTRPGGTSHWLPESRNRWRSA